MKVAKHAVVITKGGGSTLKGDENDPAPGSGFDFAAASFAKDDVFHDVVSPSQAKPSNSGTNMATDDIMPPTVPFFDGPTDTLPSTILHQTASNMSSGAFYPKNIPVVPCGAPTATQGFCRSDAGNTADGLAKADAVKAEALKPVTENVFRDVDTKDWNGKAMNLSGKWRRPVPFENMKIAVILNFRLSSSNYATVLLRELMSSCIGDNSQAESAPPVAPQVPAPTAQQV